jgi:hypothetical protein
MESVHPVDELNLATDTRKSFGSLGKILVGYLGGCCWVVNFSFFSVSGLFGYYLSCLHFVSKLLTIYLS